MTGMTRRQVLSGAAVLGGAAFATRGKQAFPRSWRASSASLLTAGSGPYLLGSVSSNATGSTAAFTVAHSAAVGDTIVLAANTNGADRVSSVTDSQGNSWTTVAASESTTGFDTLFFTARLTKALLAGTDTVHLTYSQSGSFSKYAIGMGVTGATGVDVALGSAAASGTSSATSTGGLAQPGEIVFAACAVSNSGGQPSWSSPMTDSGAGALHAGTDNWFTLGYDVVSSKQAITAGASWPTSAKWNTSLISVKVGTDAFVGANISSASFTGLTTAQAITNWTAISGRPLDVRRAYFAPGVIPAAITADLQADATAGRKVAMSLKPALDGSDQTALNTFLLSCKNAGLVADVCLYHEPFSEGLTAAQYHSVVSSYGPTVRTYFPYLYCGSSGSSAATSAYASYYVSGAFQKAAVDFYCPAYDGGFRIDSYSVVTDADNLPFGLWEFDSSTDPTAGQTQAQATAYFGYVQSFFAGRVASGLTNADLCLFFDATALSPPKDYTPITSSSDYRVALYQAIFDALDA